MTVQIRLLGGFEIRRDDVVVLGAAWKPAKAAAIVKILALQPQRTLHRDQLIDLLWPDADMEAGASSFYKNLHHLRAATRGHDLDLVTLNRGSVALDLEAMIDIATFRERARPAFSARDIAAYSEALGAYTGDLLPGDIYEAWTEPHREELRTMAQRLRLDLAERYLHRERYAEAVTVYQQAVTANPLAEDAHRGLMRAFGASGERDMALHQYELLRATLQDELAGEPSAETETLAAEIRRVDRLISPVEAAIAAPLAAADAAVRRRDFGDAAEKLRECIERLHDAGDDDEREAELWLRLSSVTAALGSRGVADHARRAAQLARRAGLGELEARALVQFQAASETMPNNHAGHRESSELISDAMARCAPGANATRAWLLAAGARPLAAAARADDEQHITGRVALAGERDPAIEGYLREAVEVARRTTDREALAYAMSRLRVYITSPDTLEERLGLTGELVELSESLHNPVSEYEAHLFRHEDLLEAGDIDGARIEARTIRRIGEMLNVQGIIAAGLSCLSTHATADGDLTEALSLLFESRSADATYGGNSNSQYRFGIQFLMIRWHQGRIEELYDGYLRAVDLAPRLNAPRASLALICAESGRLDEAREHVRTLASDGAAAIPKDYLWWLVSIFLAQAAITTGERETAEDVYRLLAPYADRNASAAGAVSFGSACHILAKLAAALGDEAAASTYFDRALDHNVRTRQRTWAARTRRDFSSFLARGDSGQAARAADLARIAVADAAEMGLGRAFMEGGALRSSGGRPG